MGIVWGSGSVRRKISDSKATANYNRVQAKAARPKITDQHTRVVFRRIRKTGYNTITPIVGSYNTIRPVVGSYWQIQIFLQSAPERPIPDLSEHFLSKNIVDKKHSMELMGTWKRNCFAATDV